MEKISGKESKKAQGGVRSNGEVKYETIKCARCHKPFTRVKGLMINSDPLRSLCPDCRDEKPEW